VKRRIGFGVRRPAFSAFSPFWVFRVFRVFRVFASIPAFLKYQSLSRKR
jgi:hypothetical protein